MRAEDILADDTNEATFEGVTVRKGTVGAFLANVRVWSDSDASMDDQLLAEREIIQSLPALKASPFKVFCKIPLKFHSGDT
ncbi:hypothetical protein SAMN05216475_1198 [Pseudomonas synxantha]|uniref:Uncharacterized protein n=1 Tax=Pseudomonas synxantha TaxID=47883 RepID=A0AAX3I3S6_9PSED|nr:hypothetical protein [Pseudomonas synxantha]AZE68123.1 hypothetical protein C4K01_3935 [Pseudomonas synxantha]KRP50748.1 hypothetical protein TU77_23280 [Pseudomonas synxantha]SDU12943.1 hypothetical protein SAMN05216475_1198 [Pseudomonas synxantha]VTQ96085.1 Uncharacterised protein [Pseudomonas synxantha]